MSNYSRVICSPLQPSPLCKYHTTKVRFSNYSEKNDLRTVHWGKRVLKHIIEFWLILIIEVVLEDHIYLSDCRLCRKLFRLEYSLGKKYFPQKKPHFKFRTLFLIFQIFFRPVRSSSFFAPRFSVSFSPSGTAYFSKRFPRRSLASPRPLTLRASPSPALLSEPFVYFCFFPSMSFLFDFWSGSPAEFCGGKFYLISAL